MGMRKDFIISEEDKLRRKQRIEDNRKLSQQSNQVIKSCSIFSILIVDLF